MKFRNPANGHVEDVAAPWLFALLFGGLYLLTQGAFVAALIWVIVAVLLFASIGPPATILVVIMNVVYVLMAGSIVRSAYLRKGWEEVKDESGSTNQAHSMPVPATLYPVRKCPYCAEEIRAEAIKCKHCGSIVEPLQTTPLDHLSPGRLSIIPPSEIPKETHFASIINRHHITQEPSGYGWNGKIYCSLENVVQAINDASA